LWFAGLPSKESVSKPEFPAAKLPKDNSQMGRFWYGGDKCFALKGREPLFYRTFSEGIEHAPPDVSRLAKVVRRLLRQEREF